MLNIVIFGPPGSGKGTQSNKIIEKYGLAHISTGDILRKEIAEKSELGITAGEIMARGELVPDHLIIDMLSKVLDNLGDVPGVIFDGFPRTKEQAAALKTMLNNRGTKVSIMLNLEVDKEELIERLLLRGKTSGRDDDNLETIEKRIVVYCEKTTPVIDFYKDQNKYVPIQGTGSIDEIFSRISQAIETVPA
jgi:adenylate kinase